MRRKTHKKKVTASARASLDVDSAKPGEHFDLGRVSSALTWWYARDAHEHDEELHRIVDGYASALRTGYEHAWEHYRAGLWEAAESGTPEALMRTWGSLLGSRSSALAGKHCISLLASDPPEAVGLALAFVLAFAPVEDRARVDGALEDFIEHPWIRLARFWAESESEVVGTREPVTDDALAEAARTFNATRERVPSPRLIHQAAQLILRGNGTTLWKSFWAPFDDRGPAFRARLEELELTRATAWVSMEYHDGPMDLFESILQVAAPAAEGSLLDVEVDPWTRIARHLRAYAEGRRYSLELQGEDFAVHFQQHIEFLNALARERGFDIRTMIVVADGEQAHVMSGPEPRLRALMDERDA